MRVKRSKYVGYYIVDGYFPDLASLITAGRFEIDYKSAILATSSLTGSEMLISIEHFARLSAISSVLGVKHSNAMPEFPPPQIGSRR
ncbi:hypothetical protein [Thermus tengchongensis]|uniref:Uncharacterized protein n=1 Tax=Thermus tengchongensis TaxID=1214928 RepID=A0A4Y9F800_9DEIN|nr:hypothetical protein [Thermus tengchongensis]TFU25201.1 hypothetical protein E0687_12080 [Thermus tengchongensis]